MIVFFAPETFHAIKLREKAKRIRKCSGDDRYKAPGDLVTRSPIRELRSTLLRPFQLLFLEPMCLCLDVYSAILLGILYLFFQAFDLVFRTTHGFNLWQIGLTFLGLIFGMIGAACTSPIWLKVRRRLASAREDSGVAVEPEYRLPPAILGGFLIPAGLFWFGWTINSSVHWIVPVLGSAVFGAG